MNMLILEPGESGFPLPRTDRRCEHISRILHKKAGDTVFAGCTDGTTGQALILRLDDRGLVLAYTAIAEAPPLYPVTLILGFPRPIQAGRILKDLCTLGVGFIHLAGTDLGEKSYIQSDFFKKNEYRTALLEGAEQAACPRIPSVTSHWTLDRCLDFIGTSDTDDQTGTVTRIVFHPAAGVLPFGRMNRATGAANRFTLAIGSERGWTERELELFAKAGFVAASLGQRILKTETAAEAAVVLALAKLGIL